MRRFPRMSYEYHYFSLNYFLSHNVITLSEMILLQFITHLILIVSILFYLCTSP